MLDGKKYPTIEQQIFYLAFIIVQLALSNLGGS
jgi:hypothetical protein